MTPILTLRSCSAERFCKGAWRRWRGRENAATARGPTWPIHFCKCSKARIPSLLVMRRRGRGGPAVELCSAFRGETRWRWGSWGMYMGLGRWKQD